MATINKYRVTSDVSPVLDFLRIIAGGVLIFVGLHFGAHPNDITGMLGSTSGFLSLFAVHYIMMCHLAGGLMLMLGIASRIAAIVQLPILLGALVLTSRGGFGTIYTNFWFTLILFIVMLLVSYYGSGRYSLDEAMRDRKKTW